MYTLTAQNKYGEQLELTHNEAYVIESIEGLDPPDAVINTTRNANADGSVYNSAYVDNRQIIITLAINGPAEANRINLYKYFKAKYPVRLYYQNATRNVYIDGYVKTLQIEFFNKKQIAQITILCPEPFFKGATNEMVEFSSVEDLFEFPFSVEESKNLLPNTMTTQTISGITFTVEDDGTIEASGTSSDYTWAAYVNENGISLPAGSYVLSGCPSGGSSTTYRLQAFVGDPSSPTLTVNDYGGGASFELAAESTVKVRMLIKGSIDATFSPMIYAREDITYSEADGDTVSVTDGSDNALVECATNIEPIQEGSGDPSPTNIRPISGFTEANVNVVGKNYMCKPVVGVTVSTSTGEISGEPSSQARSASTPVLLPITFRNNETYTISYDFDAKNMWFAYNENKEYIGRTVGSAVNQRTISANMFNTNTTGVGGEISYVVIRLYVDAPSYILQSDIDVAQIQIEKGSTATAYEPYNGQTYNVEFTDGTNPLTVYGGTLNVVSGVLVVDSAKITINDLDVTKSSNANYSFQISGMPRKYGTGVFSIISDSYKSNTTDHSRDSTIGTLEVTNDFTILCNAGTRTFFICDSRFTNNTAEEFKAANKNVELVYELETPQTYQLTPTEVRSLVGNNNIWTDTGNTHIKYISYVDLDNTYQEYGNPPGEIEFSLIITGQEKDLINTGDVESGFVIYMTARGSVVNPTIYNVDTNEFIKLNLTMLEGDEIYINTNKKQKTVQLTRNGATTNIIGNLANGSTWLILEPGDNIFTITADTSPENLDAYCILTEQFEGV